MSYDSVHSLPRAADSEQAIRARARGNQCLGGKDLGL